MDVSAMRVRLVACSLVLVGAAGCDKATSPQHPQLPAPSQLAPVDGSVFPGVIPPRTLTYTWHSVPGAVAYGLEEDCFHCCAANQWCTDVGRQWLRIDALVDTTFTHAFVGTQPGRWRVWAIDSTGWAGTRTGWWGFAFTL